ncbi:ATP-binding cassette domain-containing protein [Bacillus wiedmannii]|uniref:ATP-binding cassette domain-containing protein n=1 Tax=Bacillus wiedmannii TaxID=1890302 RepID=UPI000BF18DCD|nr:ATP-binding cassette domain-containing protein [Bacillus wiedmannii]PEI67985.1 multidrug ABC transporter ATP-binding protein [Bacillus wiedmannii]PFZ59573.1 multidrug ABC transporter ATP-binding protein [Bacillus wiedmannii]PHB64261.1 multidrug ABC transporter ATP-binding protein [Bacillus wiedmannii]PHE04589.1 multidrug ABC transporter ATP-binding protein [Bacillus wiedmannii]PHG63698.1 multidrug ABC transporter ATP-binding protein [Bacillus wiedmannii]
MNDEVYLKLNGVSKRIRKHVVLNDINLELYKGKIYGFKGRNGSGKTMLFRLICGLLKPTQGIIEINKKVLNDKISFPESVGAIIEYPGFLPDYTGYNNIKILAEIKNKISEDDIKNILLMVGLDPNDKRKFKNYSLGMKQRLGIAQALMENPDLIILDEPTNALDLEGIELVKKLLLKMKEDNKLVLIASHEKEFLESFSDEIFTIEKGEIIERKVLKEIN